MPGFIGVAVTQRSARCIDVRRLVMLVSVIASIVALDRLTKAWAEQALATEMVPILGDWFRLRLGFNPGVAFGILSQHGIWPIVLTGLVLLAVAIWMGVALRTGSLFGPGAWAMTFIFGGGVANFVDRLPDGRVTDFLDVGVGAWRWPAFNLADSFVVAGVVLMLLSSFFSRRKVADVNLAQAGT